MKSNMQHLATVLLIGALALLFNLAIIASIYGLSLFDDLSH